MERAPIPSHPVLTADETRALEERLLGKDPKKVWSAMRAAGSAVAAAALRDFREAGTFPAKGRILVLAGKGHNAGDALIAAREVLAEVTQASADVLFAFGPEKLGELALRAWRELSEAGGARVRTVESATLASAYDLCLDGIFGFQYRPPLPPEAVAAIEASARTTVRFRAAVDLPSGLGEAAGFAADFTYATGTVKTALLGCAHAGRPRYLDLGFFEDGLGDGQRARAGDRVLIRSILDPLARMRPATVDKRAQGHLLIVGGSLQFPGAVLMATLSALRSGAGLVTTLVPEPLAPAHASRAPEAMWAGLPVNAKGGLAKGALERIVGSLARATALVIGPGMGRDPETLSLVLEVVKASTVPVVIDADALQPDIVRAGSAPRILTPHEGEFARISFGASLRELCAALPAVIVRKGPLTRICEGGAVYHSLFGGPVLARGGSGDILSGLTGGLLAQGPKDPLTAACRAVAWHGIAADRLARGHGQTAVRILQLLDFLAPALRDSEG
ncbi:MAG TPA: NAD(P)H-hydrate dehydratase [Opitutaceae bacterium]|jgi:NAD(P)H-hydrate epimerase